VPCIAFCVILSRNSYRFASWIKAAIIPTYRNRHRSNHRIRSGNMISDLAKSSSHENSPAYEPLREFGPDGENPNAHDTDVRTTLTLFSWRVSFWPIASSRCCSTMPAFAGSGHHLRAMRRLPDVSYCIVSTCGVTRMI
jgi:hypothetical protein